MLAVDSALQGLDAARQKLESAASKMARAGLPRIDGNAEDIVTLSDEAVHLIEAANEYKINLRVLQTADELTGQTIDILA